MAAYKGIEYLRRRLAQKRIRVLKRYEYYEMKQSVRDMDISTPDELKFWRNNALGWCTKAVDTLANRLVFREFRDDNFSMNEIFNMNNPDILVDSAILSALIAGCSFVYISADDEGYPRLQVIDGANATGLMDQITGLLTEGYAVLERDDSQRPILEAYFTAEETIIFNKGEESGRWANPTGHPLLVPIVFRPDAKRPFGHSWISRAGMNLVDAASRTLKRAEITAEFYSVPQKYVTGLDPDAEVLDRWRATITTMLTFTKDQDGDKPTLGQFQQASMNPHLDMMRLLASMFGGDAGLTMDDMGFPSENPSSAEAIKAAHESLRGTARKAQKTFGSGLLNVGYLAACLRDQYPYQRSQVYLTQAIWEPLFEPDASMMASIGDGAYKINQVVPDYIDSEAIRDLTGVRGGA